MRTCRVCGFVGEDESFKPNRRRADGSLKRSNTCKKCDSKRRLAQRRASPELREKHARNERERIRRKTAEFEASFIGPRSIYWYAQREPEIARETIEARKRERKRKERAAIPLAKRNAERKRHAQIERAELKDAYIARCLTKSGFASTTPELIELKRAHLQLKRQINEVING